MGDERELAYLWQSANTHLHEAPELSRLLVQQMMTLAAQKKVPIPGRALHRVCGRCFTLLAPGFDCRVTQLTHPRRPAARRRSLQVHCEHCGHKSVFAAPARASSRAGQESAEHKAGGAKQRQDAASGGRKSAKSSGSAPAGKPSVSALAGAKRKQPDASSAKPRAAGATLVAKPGAKPGGTAAKKPTAATAAKAADANLFGFDFVPL